MPYSGSIYSFLNTRASKHMPGQRVNIEFAEEKARPIVAKLRHLLNAFLQTQSREEFLPQIFELYENHLDELCVYAASGSQSAIDYLNWVLLCKNDDLLYDFAVSKPYRESILKKWHDEFYATTADALYLVHRYQIFLRCAHISQENFVEMIDCLQALKRAKGLNALHARAEYIRQAFLNVFYKKVQSTHLPKYYYNAEYTHVDMLNMMDLNTNEIMTEEEKLALLAKLSKHGSEHANFLSNSKNLGTSLADLQDGLSNYEHETGAYEDKISRKLTSLIDVEIEEAIRHKDMTYVDFYIDIYAFLNRYSNEEKKEFSASIQQRFEDALGEDARFKNSMSGTI